MVIRNLLNFYVPLPWLVLVEMVIITVMSFFSERELTLMFAIRRRPSACRRL